MSLQVSRAMGRALSRAAPLRSLTAVSTFRNFTPRVITAVRHFSEGNPAPTNTKRALLNALGNEIEDARQHMEETDAQDTQDVPNQFTMESTDAATVVLKKTFNDEKITITVNAQDLEESDPTEEEHPDEEAVVDPEEELDEEGEVGVNCQIKFEKEGSALVIDACAWASSSWSIRHITTEPEGVYAGPKAEDLDEELMHSFYDYMEERGLDSDMATFVAATSYTKEGEMYNGWLQSVNDYVSK